MTTETPRDRFERVIRPRVEKALHAIDLLGNGASRDYETTPGEIRTFIAGLRKHLDQVEARYAKRFGEGEALDVGNEPPAAGDAAAGPGQEGPANELRAAMQGLRWGHVSVVAAEIDAALVAPLVTQLIARLDDMANGRAK